ncbi:MAG: hypothetical protein IT426_15820 [Pirellulales bacterium]|nr:hypothetical protein [Pirellulales bacterium]
MNVTHRAKKSDKYVLWGSLVFWTILAAIIVPLIPEMKTNEDARWAQLPFQIFMALFFLFWILYSVLGLIHVKRYQLHVSDDAVEKTGIFRHRAIDLNDLTAAQWLPLSDFRGRLVLRTSERKIAIGFRDLPREQAHELVMFFRHRLPESSQKDWNRYWEKNWRTFDELEKLSPEEIAAAKQASKRFLIRWCSFGWIMLVIGDFVAWRYTGEKKWLVQPLGAFIILFFFVYYFSKSLVSTTRGKIGKTRPKSKITMVAAISFLGAFIIPFLIMASRIFPHDSWEEGFFMILSMLILVIPVFWSIYKQNKPIQEWNREAAKTAAELYLRVSPSIVKEK